MKLRARLASPGTAPVAGPIPVVEGGALLELRGVTAARRDVVVLHDVDLVVRAGELVAVVGPNGAGKSTLFAVAAGDLAPAAGRVHLHGRPLDDVDDRARARLRAVLTQQHTVGFPFRVVDVVAMGRSPWTTPDPDDPVVHDAMAAAQITHLADRSVRALSGGESARVGLARALAQQTQLLLLDEPTAALDVRHEEASLAAVGARVRAGGGAAIVLHDLALAAEHADRVVVVAGGRIVADGPPVDVLTPDLLSATYHHPIDVHPHPVTGAPLPLPRRRRP